MTPGVIEWCERCRLRTKVFNAESFSLSVSLRHRALAVRTISTFLYVETAAAAVAVAVAVAAAVAAGYAGGLSPTPPSAAAELLKTQRGQLTFPIITATGLPHRRVRKR